MDRSRSAGVRADASKRLTVAPEEERSVGASADDDAGGDRGAALATRRRLQKLHREDILHAELAEGHGARGPATRDWVLGPHLDVFFAPRAESLAPDGRARIPLDAVDARRSLFEPGALADETDEPAAARARFADVARAPIPDLHGVAVVATHRGERGAVRGEPNGGDGARRFRETDARHLATRPRVPHAHERHLRLVRLRILHRLPLPRRRERERRVRHAVERRLRRAHRHARDLAGVSAEVSLRASRRVANDPDRRGVIRHGTVPGVEQVRGVASRALVAVHALEDQGRVRLERGPIGERDVEIGRRGNRRAAPRVRDLPAEIFVGHGVSSARARVRGVRARGAADHSVDEDGVFDRRAVFAAAASATPRATLGLVEVQAEVRPHQAEILPRGASRVALVDVRERLREVGLGVARDAVEMAKRGAHGGVELEEARFADAEGRVAGRGGGRGDRGGAVGARAARARGPALLLRVVDALVGDDPASLLLGDGEELARGDLGPERRGGGATGRLGRGGGSRGGGNRVGAGGASERGAGGGRGLGPGLGVGHAAGAGGPASGPVHREGPGALADSQQRSRGASVTRDEASTGVHTSPADVAVATDETRASVCRSPSRRRSRRERGCVLSVRAGPPSRV